MVNGSNGEDSGLLDSPGLSTSDDLDASDPDRGSTRWEGLDDASKENMHTLTLWRISRLSPGYKAS